MSTHIITKNLKGGDGLCKFHILWEKPSHTKPNGRHHNKRWCQCNCDCYNVHSNLMLNLLWLHDEWERVNISMFLYYYYYYYYMTTIVLRLDHKKLWDTRTQTIFSLKIVGTEKEVNTTLQDTKHACMIGHALACNFIIYRRGWLGHVK